MEFTASSLRSMHSVQFMHAVFAHRMGLTCIPYTNSVLTGVLMSLGDPCNVPLFNWQKLETKKLFRVSSYVNTGRDELEIRCRRYLQPQPSWLGVHQGQDVLPNTGKHYKLCWSSIEWVLSGRNGEIASPTDAELQIQNTPSLIMSS